MKRQRLIKIIHILIVPVLILLSVSAVLLVWELQKAEQETEAFSEIAATAPILEETAALPARDLRALQAQNEDLLGWISVPDTAIDYPVMYTPTAPEKYLRRNFAGEYSRAGVPFLDEDCTPQDSHLIIYGHNMQNGTMFSLLTKYTDAQYCKAHPTVQLQIGSENEEYTVFAVAKLGERDAWYDTTQMTLAQRISYIKEKALYDTGVTPKGQQLLTLSTCQSGDRQQRIVVVCIK